MKPDKPHELKPFPFSDAEIDVQNKTKLNECVVFLTEPLEFLS